VKPGRVLLVPPVAVALYLAVRLATGDPTVDRVTNVIAFVFAAGGCLAATLAFERGDYLRLGWLLQAISNTVLIGASFLRWPDLPVSVLAGRVALTFIANACGVAGMVVFARAHVAAGLELPWSRQRQRVLLLVTVGAALIAAGPSLVLNVPAALAGDLATWSRMISGVGDILVFSLIAPLTMTALALRGGLLVWPWALYTASTVCWLLYDAQDSAKVLVPALAGEPLTVGAVTLRVLACTLIFAAGWTQRLIVTRAERD
jgi:hypothetical protein